MDNFEREIAEKFVRETSEHIFLTGKAGTGKTTFLREVVTSISKKFAIVAPTGVAAINAGGSTIHSMFGLPTRAYIPSRDDVDPNIASNMNSMTRHFHFNRQKIKLLTELELLIIDEVSMVRCDILDAVDLCLRFVRRNQKPFGGVQMLFIGDMFQLPPVIRDIEWPVLSKYYNGPFFFNSQVFQNLDPVYIELKKIYRQSDRKFIGILNNIRNQEFEMDDYEDLKQHYKPEFVPDEQGYITLTTHNRKADGMNEAELARLDGEEVVFDAAVDGDFSDSMFPAERLLRLKEGAQVMFVKNDTSGERKYFNGKIGTVTWMDPYGENEDERIRVLFPDTGEKIWVPRETWENLKYTFNESENKIEQNRIGSFEQYPLRLAWAITIHKSQGLTFEKAVVDAGESFAPGQVYVALSRCTGMEHLVLKSLITNRNIFSDPRLVDFNTRMMKEMVLENRLEEARRRYTYDKILATFDFVKLQDAIRDWDKAVAKLKSVPREETFKKTNRCLLELEQLQQIALKFQKQLKQLIDSEGMESFGSEQLVKRAGEGVNYFTNELYNRLYLYFKDFMEEYRLKKQTKKLLSECAGMESVFWNKIEELQRISIGGERVSAMKLPARSSRIGQKEKQKKKGTTYSETLELLRNGKTIDEIADIRNMAAGTIEAHIQKLISSGDVRIDDVMSREKQELIMKELKTEGFKVSDVKSRLGDSATWSEIRWAIASANLTKSSAHS